jgi:hypothetical protein
MTAEDDGEHRYRSGKATKAAQPPAAAMTPAGVVEDG